MPVKLRLVLQNAFIDLLMVLTKMRWKSDNKLIKQCTSAVNIGSSVVALAR